MPPIQKKRKVDIENRAFNEEWKLTFFFHCREGSQNPTCLICSETLAVCKKANIERHYNSKHKATFEKNFPQTDLDRRKVEFERRFQSQASQQRILFSAISSSDHVTEASFRICHLLAKYKKSYSDAEIIKECFIAGSETLFSSFANKEKIVAEIKKLSLSNDTCTRRCEKLAEDVLDQLVSKLQGSSYWSIAIDESTDATDVAQLSIFVRYFDGVNKSISEDLLSLYPLKNTTTARDIFLAVSAVIDSFKLNWDTLVSVTTDGAPSRLGKDNGFVAMLKKKLNRNLISYHCIIHQQALTAKLNKNLNLEVVMKKVVKIVNTIRAHPLAHRQFRALLQEVESQYNDLVLFNNVRWLSRGEVLERFTILLPQIETFLISIGKVFPELCEDSFRLSLGILCDISRHVNCLNRELQGKGKIISELFEHVMSFKGKLQHFQSQVVDLDFTHFSRTASLARDLDFASQKLGECLTNLLDAINERFLDFSEMSDLFIFLKTPFLVKLSVSRQMAEKFGASKAECELELIELKNQLGLKEQIVENDLATFWIQIVPERFKELRTCAIKLLVMFGSTYLCESAFSDMNIIKNKFRSSLTDSHLHNLLHLGCSKLEPRFSQLSKNMQNQGSH